MTIGLDELTASILGKKTGGDQQLLSLLQGAQAPQRAPVSQVGQLGAFAAHYGDQRNADMNAFLGRARGVDPSQSPQAVATQKLTQLMSGDMTDPAKQQTVLKILQGMGQSDKALEMASVFAAQNKAAALAAPVANAFTNAQNDVANKATELERKDIAGQALAATTNEELNTIAERLDEIDSNKNGSGKASDLADVDVNNYMLDGNIVSLPTNTKSGNVADSDGRWVSPQSIGAVRTTNSPQPNDLAGYNGLPDMTPSERKVARNTFGMLTNVYDVPANLATQAANSGVLTNITQIKEFATNVNQEKKDAAEAMVAVQQMTPIYTSMDTALATINDVSSKIGGVWGNLTKAPWATDARRLEDELAPFKSGAVLDTIQNMRSEITGATGFGSMQEREFAAIENLLVGFSELSDPVIMRERIIEAKHHFDNVRRIKLKQPLVIRQKDIPLYEGAYMEDERGQMHVVIDGHAFKVDIR